MDLNDVIDKLLDTPYACRKGDEYVYVRCPICGDSVKHRDKPHCNIWIKPLQPLIYHCWICEESGIVDREFLESMILILPIRLANIIKLLVELNVVRSLQVNLRIKKSIFRRYKILQLTE